MARSIKRALALVGGAAALAAGIAGLGPVLGQSILPPGFGDSAPPPSATPPAASGADGAIPVIPLDAPSPGEVVAGDQAQADAEAAQASAQAAADALRRQDVPEFARRPVDRIGFLDPAVTGVPADGFGAADGRFLATLMNRLDAPIASRWLSILLRRVLTTDVLTPPAIDPADWVAARARLLVRMGEADAARLLVQRIDTDRATPGLYAAILDTALATADPAALCPVADQAEAALATVPAWPLARAMCQGLSGENGTALGLADRARARTSGIDFQLAERVIGAGTGARRAINIEWSSVNELTPWRFGLASAVGLTIPATLLDGGGLAMQAWRARAPMLPLAGRIGAERTAATLGVVSAADLVDAYAAVADTGDADAIDQTPAGRLRAAYVARDPNDRMAALRALWADPTTERDGYAGRILTARAAARIPVSDADTADVPALIAAMLSAGLDIQAARWTPIAQGAGGTPGEEARALLSVGAPGAIAAPDADDIAAFGAGGRGASRLRAQYLFAGLAGLGRLDPRQVGQLAGTLAVPISAANPWTRALNAAVARGEPGSVVLLAAVGMQTSDWTQVDPAFLYHIVLALRGVGYEAEARMIAAEALSRT